MGVVIGGWDTKPKTLELYRCVGDAQYHSDRRAGTLVIRVPKMTKDEIKTAREMYESGNFFFHEIAKAVNKATESVFKRVHRDGWQRSPAAAAIYAAKIYERRCELRRLRRG